MKTIIAILLIVIFLSSCGTSKPTIIYFEKDTTAIKKVVDSSQMAYLIKDSSDCGR